MGALDPLARRDRAPTECAAISNVSLFVVGTLVTLIVLSALALLIWGAVLDGRYEQGRQGPDFEAGTQTDEKPPVAAAVDALPLPQAH